MSMARDMSTGGMNAPTCGYIYSAGLTKESTNIEIDYYERAEDPHFICTKIPEV